MIDIRHQPTADDQMMYEWLDYQGIPTLIIATKADKISKGKLTKHLKAIRTSLQLEKDVPLIPFSAETGQGKEEAWRVIKEYIQESREEV